MAGPAEGGQGACVGSLEEDLLGAMMGRLVLREAHEVLKGVVQVSREAQ